MPPLTTTEIAETIEALAQCPSKKAAARELGISPRAIDFRIESIARRATADMRGMPSADDIALMEERVEEAKRAKAEAETRVDRYRKQRDEAVEAAERVRSAERSGPQLRTRAQRKARGEKLTAFVCDYHGDQHEPPAVAAAIEDFGELELDRIVYGGDMVDCGGFLAQHGVLGYVADNESSYEQDIAATNAFLDACQKAAPDAEHAYIEGNHELRVMRWVMTQTMRHEQDAEYLGRLVGPKTLLGIEARGMQWYSRGEKYDGLSVPGTIKRGKIHYAHPTKAPRNAAAAFARDFAANVAYGHTHRADSYIIRTVANNAIGAWCPGCLCKLQPTYAHTDPTQWSHGYLLIIEDSAGDFLAIPVPIVDGRSLLSPLLDKLKA